MALFEPPSTLPPTLFDYYLKYSRSSVKPALPIALFKWCWGWCPVKIVRHAAFDFFNLGGDLLAGNRLLRDDEAYKRWRKKRIADLLIAMKQANSLEKYEVCTTELDVLQGHEAWKEATESIEAEYNPQQIRVSTERLHTAAASSDVDAMLHLIRTQMSRDLGNMGLLRLYKHSWFGTKNLIGDYIEAAVATIETLQEVTKQRHSSTAESKQYLGCLEDALRYFGRSALNLSGGANLGMKHIGVVKALWEAELLPDIISGTSAGSIVAAVAASATDEEMDDVFQRFHTADLAVFDPVGTKGVLWAWERGSTMVKDRVFFNMAYLERIMKWWLKDMTFKEAHHKTGRVLNITISSADGSEARLLNHITAPDVFLWSAVCASCSVPVVYKPATIYEKDLKTGKAKAWMLNSQQWLDGSLDHDIPMRKLSEMFNVNFFIVSQVNPHVRFFLEAEEKFNGVQPTRPARRRNVVRSVVNLMRKELVFRAQLGEDIPTFKLVCRLASVFNQQYTGHLNIFPDIERLEWCFMMANPTPDFMLKATKYGERATWPKMCRIKNSVAVEKALIGAIAEFKIRAHFGTEAAEARQKHLTLRGRDRRPSFLRRRSLSSEAWGLKRHSFGRGRSGPPSPSPYQGVKRNISAGTLVETIWQQFKPLTTTQPSVLTPQAGIGQDMTTPTPMTRALSPVDSRNRASNAVFTLGGECESEPESPGLTRAESRLFVPDGSTPNLSSSPIQSYRDFIQHGGSAVVD